MSGRGQYFKNLYGGGRSNRGYHSGSAHATRRGRSHVEERRDVYIDSRDTNRSTDHSTGQKRRREESRGTIRDLARLLERLNAKSYPAYRDIEGFWSLHNSTLHVDYIQNDPFAPPSKFRLHIPHANARFPPTLYNTAVRETALCDFLARSLYSAVSKLSPRLPAASLASSWSSAKGGIIAVDKPGQQVLQRSSVVLDEEGIEARFTISLPAQGRTILGREAADIFGEQVPRLEQSLMFSSCDPTELEKFIDCIDDQENLRLQLQGSGLVAFIRNGAILPRASGVSDLPLRGAVPFQSPPSLLCSFNLPHRGVIEGMGIPEGVTMIAGGGFHGKSTLLDALAKGCYNHIPEDGREFVIASENIVSLQSEDGRSIQNVNISPFIGKLPGNVNTDCFKTEDASGSTSMAASVIEAMELGADTLLFDEDTCATNFLIRDTRMQKLIKSDPINPLVFNVRAMHCDRGCSSILVIGGCGDYCDVADVVLEMRDYSCYDITPDARKVAEEVPSMVTQHETPTFPAVQLRHIHLPSLPTPQTKTAARKLNTIDITLPTKGSQETLDLRALGQIVSESQTRAIASALKSISGIVRSQDILRTLKREVQGDSDDGMDGGQPSENAAGREKQWTSLNKALRLLKEALDDRGLDRIMEDGKLDPFLARPRAIEVGMAINRLRSARISYISTKNESASTSS